MSEELRSTVSRESWLRWLRAAVATCIVVAFALLLLEGVLATGVSDGFVLGVGAILGVELLIFRRVIASTRRVAGPQRITIASWITIGRAAALALLAGFLLEPATGSLVWIPGTLYAIAAVLDAVDGNVARLTDSVTELGARLDVEMDGLTVLIGALLAVAYGAAPLYFLAVGFARYAFVFGIWWRTRRDKVVFELPPSRLRRPLGALAMIAIWIALVPIPGETPSRLLAIVVSVPFLANFAWDWLAVSGRTSHALEPA